MILIEHFGSRKFIESTFRFHDNSDRAGHLSLSRTRSEGAVADVATPSSVLGQQTSISIVGSQLRHDTSHDWHDRSIVSA